MKKCPFCAEEIRDEAIKCKHCREMLTTAPQPSAVSPPPPPQQAGIPALTSIGFLLLIAGLGTVAYFLLSYDTSVAVPETTIMGQSVGGGRVHNVGLMQNRQIGIILGSVIAAAGLTFMLAGTRRNNTASIAASTPPKWLARAAFYVVAVIVALGMCALIIHKIAEYNSQH